VYSLTNSRGKYNVETNYQQRFSDAKIASKTIIDGWLAMAGDGCQAHRNASQWSINRVNSVSEKRCGTLCRRFAITIVPASYSQLLLYHDHCREDNPDTPQPFRNTTRKPGAPHVRTKNNCNHLKSNYHRHKST
jgi:hypothetical protein